jgi:hypothetical protein
MNIIKLDFRHGSAWVDLEIIAFDEKGVLTRSITKLCSPAVLTDKGRTQYRLLGKASVCGKSADCVIEVGEEIIYTLTFSFDLIEFFESSILESKVIKACEKSLNVNFASDHPSTAFLAPCKWGRATFFYDAKQGDLSLEITFKCNSNK